MERKKKQKRRREEEKENKKEGAEEGGGQEMKKISFLQLELMNTESELANWRWAKGQ